MKYNSTYGLRHDWSYKSEQFYSISTSWRLGSRPILKIRIAHWKHKNDRTNSAIMYYDVCSKQQAQNILTNYESFDFKIIEDEFETMWLKDNFEDKGYFNTGETNNWWNNKFLPYIRTLLIHHFKTSL